MYSKFTAPTNLQSDEKLEPEATSVREVSHQSEELGLLLMLEGNVDLVTQLRSRRLKELSQDELRPQIGVAFAIALEMKVGKI